MKVEIKAGIMSEEDVTEEDIWEQAQRFMDSIRDEIKSENPDQVSIGFWLFKIERKVHMLKEHLYKEK
ncbi:hypothetical protein LCGC14_3057300 [marine sediment metagenome]|uniref:Uncharacterized protein n=1 Tax=marine sediment metagenome TaxID=412755 RepID=A0A0F8X874_9ZZZZ|nr:hypothetical protein [Candidatus Scalindua sp.]